MKSASSSRRRAALPAALLVALTMASTSALADTAAPSNLQFRRPEVGGRATASAAPQLTFREMPAEDADAPKTQTAKKPVTGPPRATTPVKAPATTAAKPAASKTLVQAKFEQTAQPLPAAPAKQPRLPSTTPQSSPQPLPTVPAPTQGTTDRNR